MIGLAIDPFLWGAAIAVASLTKRHIAIAAGAVVFAVLAHLILSALDTSGGLGPARGGRAFEIGAARAVDFVLIGLLALAVVRWRSRARQKDTEQPPA